MKTIWGSLSYHPVRAQTCYPLISVVSGVNDDKAGNIAGLLAKPHLCCQSCGSYHHVMVSQNEGYLFGVPIIRVIVFWGLYWGPPVLGNYHVSF